MGEGHAYSTYELPILKLLKYFIIIGVSCFILGWVMRYSNADYLLAVWLWQVFILTYYYVTVPAIALMCIVAYLARRKKPIKVKT